jgi:hypothetical protein
MGACVSLNIMWLHVDQASFKMTAAQYQDKLDSVAQLVNVLGQTDKVREPGQTLLHHEPNSFPCRLKGSSIQVPLPTTPSLRLPTL